MASKINKMKINWVKGFDRIAILISVPLAIFGAYYCSKKYSESKAVWVYLSAEEEKELEAACKNNPKTGVFDLVFAKEIFDIPNFNGIIAEGKEELRKQAEKSPIANRILSRALEEENADPEGTLINRRFGLETFTDDDWFLIPSKTKRYFAGFIGFMAFALATILSICIPFRILPRVLKWVKNGFIQN